VGVVARGVSGRLDQGAGLRRLAKNDLRISPHSCARTPATKGTSWLSRGSESTL